MRNTRELSPRQLSVCSRNPDFLEAAPSTGDKGLLCGGAGTLGGWALISPDGPRTVSHLNFWTQLWGQGPPDRLSPGLPLEAPGLEGEPPGTQALGVSPECQAACSSPF